MNNVKVWVVKPISNQKILPDTLAPTEPTAKMSAKACRGHYVPFSFCIRSEKPLVGLHAEMFSPGWQANFRYVKCWWQAGRKTKLVTEPTFTPELLLKDARLVEVDMEAKRNVIRRPVQDAVKLQPIYLEANYTQQYWVTVSVPYNVKANKYNFFMRLYLRGEVLKELPITVELLPFNLARSDLSYNIYYTGVLVDSDVPLLIEDAGKTPEQYLAEMENLVSHGISNATCYQPRGNAMLEEVVRLRQKARINTDPFFSCGSGNHTGWAWDALGLKDLQIRVLQKRVRLAHFGIRNVFLYGRDEASGEELTKQRPAWQAVHKAGGKVCASIRPDALESMSDLLDVAIARPDCKNQISQWHEKGVKILLYSDPQVCVEQPETYRRNYGLQLLADGWDGCCPFAYQHATGKSIWDDFDDDHAKPRRDHVFAYPTVDGVVDTIQWEGFREGVTDVRFATTLKNLGGTLPEFKDRDLDEVREEIIDRIIELLPG